MMALHGIDIAVCLWCLLVLAWLGFRFPGRAGGGFEDWLLAGRKLPWGLLGLSMVATSFASDTPLAVTGLVGKGGIAGNWLWWSLLAGTTMTACLFAAPWRRSRLVSDVEFAALRYGGNPGGCLRGFRALYMSLFFSGIILAWVLKAMGVVLVVLLDLDPRWNDAVLYGLVALALAYTLASGLWGVVATDLVQLVLASFGAVALAVLASAEAGGQEGLRARLVDGLPAGPAGGFDPFSFLPDLGGQGLCEGAGLLLLFQLSMQWWAVVFPGNEPGGGSYLAQRMLAARSPKDARRGITLYVLLHYALRPWPWIFVGLWAAGRYALPEDQVEKGYVFAMRDLLPPGLLGLALAGFLAAFLSTVDTHLNLAAGYLVNDLYKPLLARRAGPRHLLRAARLALLLVAAVALWFARSVTSVAGAWKILIALGAGTGLVLLLRWFWWRINAWSEIAAMTASFACAFVLEPGLRAFVLGREGAEAWSAWSGLPASPIPGEGARLFAIFGASTLVWLGVTLMTPAVPLARLRAFYERVRPSGLWAPVFDGKRPPEPAADLRSALVDWALTTFLAFCLLFGVGKLCFGDPLAATVLLLAALLAGFLLWGNAGAASAPRSSAPRRRPRRGSESS